MGLLRSSSFAPFSIPLMTLALGSGAVAAEKPLAPEILRLQAFVGSWKGRLELKEADKPAQLLSFAMECRSAAGGSAVRCTASEKNEELDVEEASLFGYDPSEQLVHFYAVTNQAETHDHQGRWTDDTTLALEHKGIVEGKPFGESLSIVFKARNAFAAEFVGLLDGKEIYRGKIQAAK